MTTEPTSKESLRRKYDRIGPTYSGPSGQYVDPDAVARHQVDLVRSWGRRIGPGAKVLEIGGADGFVTEALVRAGYLVSAFDLSPGMVEVTRRRLAAHGLTADLRVGDVDSVELDESFDVVLAVMRAFFTYASDPVDALARLAPHTGVKLLVDFDPRKVPLSAALGAVRDAGFDHVTWRPFFVPRRRRLPRAGLLALAGMERVPVARTLPLRWRGHVVVKGERRHPASWAGSSP